MGNVTRDLQKMEGAFRVGIGQVAEARDIGGRDERGSAQLWALARDDGFWARTALLYKLMTPLRELSAWVRGCDCHERERMQGKQVKCDWQRCRAGG